ncbi:hypothetical protein [Streptomyces sp. NPDC087212]|uniref:hypothetical protein n=1 Tax=Streptomyces sp. NPDC087212 TaxID=3365766 RepID=UPI0038112952
MTARDKLMRERDNETPSRDAGIEPRVRMTLRVSHDSGRTWGRVTEVRENQDLLILGNSAGFPPRACPRCTDDEPRSGPALVRCAHWRRLPSALAREARLVSASGCVDGALQCQLCTHDDGEHYGLLDEAEYGSALWLRWRGSTGTELAVLPDCPVADPGPGGEACCLFAGHVESHTWAGVGRDDQCP